MVVLIPAYTAVTYRQVKNIPEDSFKGDISYEI
jgi:hypothetical protein